MKIQHFVIIITTFIFCFSCKQENAVGKIEAVQTPVTDSVIGNPAIEKFVTPYRTRVNSDLDSILAYSPYDMSDRDGEFETALGNMIADMVVAQGDPIFEKRTGKHIDFCLVNHGGIRADIAKGAVTKRTAYEVLPFENAIVVTELTADNVRELVTYLSKAKRAHPISGMTLTLNEDYSVNDVKINGMPIDDSKTYNVVTNDYLQNGGDGMVFFSDPIALHVLDYKIRNAMIDYFIKIDSLPYTLDKRFIRIQ